ncbi:dehydratase [Stenotrophomonas ginsengisoli]|uniref:Dehydratase n=1 Tax=Stenotrophomonas ginsengisoli TaxID=336566 RepID=A0A0R0DAI6_9GAMM|nr:dehydratase [Stenotrophomonas ginsengisoli]KRG75586.1 dehydratase [Stenotrophomonas ginsengisoli]
MHFSIPADHPCLPGHFPGHPLVPGVVVLEQVIAAVARQHGLPAGRLRLPQVKFLAPLYPQQRAEVVLQGQAPRWKFQVLGPAGTLVRGELVIDAADV